MQKGTKEKKVLKHFVRLVTKTKITRINFNTTPNYFYKQNQAISAYVDKNKIQYAKYSKKGNIDYNVYLKENNYFDYDHLGTDKQYISSLIEYINADFDYNLLLDSKNVNYLYSYKV